MLVKLLLTLCYGAEVKCLLNLRKLYANRVNYLTIGKSEGIGMRKLRRSVNQWITQYTQLPKDIIFDYPRMTMIGHIHLYIENHRGLTKFESNEIIIDQTHGRVIVKGENMVIKNLFKREMLIEGTILSIDIEPSAERS